MPNILCPERSENVVSCPYEFCVLFDAQNVCTSVNCNHASRQVCFFSLLTESASILTGAFIMDQIKPAQQSSSTISRMVRWLVGAVAPLAQCTMIVPEKGCCSYQASMCGVDTDTSGIFLRRQKVLSHRLTSDGQSVADQMYRVELKLERTVLRKYNDTCMAVCLRTSEACLPRRAECHLSIFSLIVFKAMYIDYPSPLSGQNTRTGVGPAGFGWQSH